MKLLTFLKKTDKKVGKLIKRVSGFNYMIRQPFEGYGYAMAQEGSLMFVAKYFTKHNYDTDERLLFLRDNWKKRTEAVMFAKPKKEES